MKGLVLDAKWDPRPEYEVSDWQKKTARPLQETAFGAQGHSGHETFPNVIRMVAAGRLDLSPIVTARYGSEAMVEAITKSTECADGKILVKSN